MDLYFKQGLDISKPGVEKDSRKSAFKLHEKRQSMRKLEIKIGLMFLRHNPSSGLSPRTSGELRSPNPQDILALVHNPVTPLGSYLFENGYSPSSVTTTPTSCNVAYDPPTPTSESSSSAISEEGRAIAEKGFYLHPSPLNNPHGSGPKLLPLFPLTVPSIIKLINTWAHLASSARVWPRDLMEFYWLGFSLELGFSQGKHGVMFESLSFIAIIIILTIITMFSLS